MDYSLRIGVWTFRGGLGCGFFVMDCGVDFSCWVGLWFFVAGWAVDFSWRVGVWSFRGAVAKGGGLEVLSTGILEYR